METRKIISASVPRDFLKELDGTDVSRNAPALTRFIPDGKGLLNRSEKIEIGIRLFLEHVKQTDDA